MSRARASFVCAPNCRSIEAAENVAHADEDRDDGNALTGIRVAQPAVHNRDGYRTRGN